MFQAGNSVLLLKRTDAGNYWAFPGGKIEEDETPKEAAIRECFEETQKVCSESLHQIDQTELATVNFITFAAQCERFTPELNEEHSEFMWASLDALPDGLHPGVKMTLDNQEKTNASQFPRFYYAKHMQPGICRYLDGVVLVDTDAMKKMIATGAGKPVFIDHQKVDLDTMKEKAVGWITESFYNDLDGWAWFKIMITDDEGHKVISDGWKCSDAYIPTTKSGGGTKNNCPYKEEITDGFYTHLAIVTSPRYEQADILTPEEFKSYQDDLKRQLTERTNSTTEGNFMKITNMFKTKTVKEPVTTIDDDTMVELEGGKIVSVKEMVNAMEKKNTVMDIDTVGDQMINANGVDMPLKELVNRYNAMCEDDKKNKKNSKKNSDDDADDKKKSEDDELMDKKNKKNSDDSDDGKNKDDDEKKNAKDKADADAKAEDEAERKAYHELLNAHEKPLKAETKVEAPGNGLKRGMQRYGSTK